MRKLLLCLLCFVLVLGCVPVTAQTPNSGTLLPTQSNPAASYNQTQPTNVAQSSAATLDATVSAEGSAYLFYDDFEADTTLLSRGWELEMAQQDGKMVATQDNLVLGVAGATNWKNYRIEADICIDESQPNSAYGTNASGLVGRSTKNATDGYEFALLKSTASNATVFSPYLRVYDRKNLKELGRVDFSAYRSGTTYHLTLEFMNDKLYAYVDGILYITADVSADTCGTAGVHTNCYTTYVDHFKVTDLTNYEPLLPVNPSATVYTDDFEDESPATDPSHWAETITNNAPHLPLYGDVLVYDDFSADSSLISRGWEIEATRQNGQMYSRKNNLWLGTGATTWQNYRVEADILIDETPVQDGSKSSVSGIVGRTTKNGANGYELALYVPTSAAPQSITPRIRLYDRKTKTELFSADFSSQYVPGTTYHLAMEFIDSVVYCSVDDFTFSAAIDRNGVGTAGVHASTYFTYFDHFKITEITGYQPVEAIDYFKTTEVAGNRVYRGSAEGYATSWLHIFEADPVLQADLSFTALPTTGKAGILGRYNVELSYVQGGYDFAEQKWYVASSKGVDYGSEVCYSDATPLTANTAYTLQLQLKENTACLYVNGLLVLECAVTQNAYGKAAVFVDGVTADFDNIVFGFPSGQSISADVVSWTFYEETIKNVCEVDVLGNEVLAFASGGAMYSEDFGKTFVRGSGPYSLDTRDYTSTIEVEKGKYLRILSNPMTAQVSDDMKTWTTTATLVPLEEEKDADTGKWRTIIHVNSMTKIRLPNGKTRIFIPIGFRKFNGTNIVGHLTRVFYTDDGGYTWSESENDTTNIPGHDEPTDAVTMSEGTSFCEAKVISCADGTLRMYSTRNWATCVYYVESKDWGVTWSSWGKIESMPCAISSFAVCEDPTAPGTWYMLYVKDVPKNINQILPRTHLVLCKTTDGKNWTEVMTVDRTTNIGDPSTANYYQFLDPCLVVTEGYFYFGYGRSDQKKSNSVHHMQKQRYLRIGREHTHQFDNDQDATCNLCNHVRELYKVGDLNGDGLVTDADSVHLLMHTFFSDVYPVNQPCDFNGDDLVTDADAVYLLMYTFFPEVYPIT